MTQELFKAGSTVAVSLIDNPLAEDEEDLMVAGYVVERDATGLLLDSGVPELGNMYIPWTNIANVVAVDFEAVEQTPLPDAIPINRRRKPK